jgi:hypothetical protein
MDSATEEQLKAENEKLNSENERLNAEMASMKKKIKLAMKKQQADLQAKIQAVEQRAAAAEGALAAADAPAISNGGAAALSQSNPQIPVAESADDVTDSAASSLSTLSSLGRANGDTFHHPLLHEGNGESRHSQAHVDSLVAELANERRQRLEREDVDLKERQRLDNEIIECNYPCI